MLTLPAHIRLVEKSWIARLAAIKLKSYGAALVLGNAIHLYNITKQEFLSSPRLVRHELKHIDQYQRFGVFGFLSRYAWYSLKYGYFNNPLEQEARGAEDYALDFEKEQNFGIV
jgi:hypothetical protein